jgi:hypothetical protein
MIDVTGASFLEVGRLYLNHVARDNKVAGRWASLQFEGETPIMTELEILAR